MRKYNKRINKAEKKQYFIVEEAIFHLKCHVFLNYSEGDMIKWCKGKDILDTVGIAGKNFAATSFELEHENKPTQWGIVVKNFNWSLGSQGTLIHEIVHTIIKMWDSNNIPHNKDTQEFLAHSIANLYEDIAAKILGIKKIKR